MNANEMRLYVTVLLWTTGMRASSAVVHISCVMLARLSSVVTYIMWRKPTVKCCAYVRGGVSPTVSRTTATKGFCKGCLRQPETNTIEKKNM